MDNIRNDNNIEKIINIEINDEMKKSYLEYSM